MYDVINLLPGPKAISLSSAYNTTVEAIAFFMIVNYFSDYHEQKAVSFYEYNRTYVTIDPSGVLKDVVQASMKKKSCEL